MTQATILGRFAEQPSSVALLLVGLARFHVVARPLLFIVAVYSSIWIIKARNWIAPHAARLLSGRRDLVVTSASELNKTEAMTERIREVRHPSPRLSVDITFEHCASSRGALNCLVKIRNHKV